jgi:formylglycine-generating enzyme required for sulfatase activity
MDGQVYPWGNQAVTCDLANYKYCVADTTQVGSYPGSSSPYGALDMSGNVLEWVADWYARDYYQTSPLDNPIGPSSGDRRVLRGGSWTFDWDRVRAAYRGFFNPANEDHYIGFRCALSP